MHYLNMDRECVIAEKIFRTLTASWRCYSCNELFSTSLFIWKRRPCDDREYDHGYDEEKR